MVLWVTPAFSDHRRAFTSELHRIDHRSNSKCQARNDNQFGRRNLADIDRIALARKREDVLKPLAEHREKRGKGDDGSGGRGNKKNPSAELRQGFKTSKESAKTAGVGERTYDAGKLILEAAAGAI